MTVEEVEVGRLHGKIRVHVEKFHFASVGVFVDTLAVVALVKRRLDLVCQVRKQEQSFDEVKQKLQFASSAALSAQHCNLAIAEEVGMWGKELKEKTQERVVVAKVAVNKERDNSKTAKEDASKFKADFVAKLGRWQDNVGGSTK